MGRQRQNDGGCLGDELKPHRREILGGDEIPSSKPRFYSLLLSIIIYVFVSFSFYDVLSYFSWATI